MNIDIIAPSGTITPSDLMAIRHLLLSWDMTPHIPDDLLGEDLLCANTDEQRFNHLKRALLNNVSDVIWCARGGYGCTRLLPSLLKVTRPQRQKLLIGCSDITALHIFLQQHWGWSTLHAPGAKQAALGKVSKNDVLAIKHLLLNLPSLQKEWDSFNHACLPLNAPIQQKNHITGTITGGNLSLVQASIGTFWQIETRNKILFLEEIHERGYRIDRMLEHLRQAGILDNLQALIFGDFIGNDKLIMPILQRFANTCPYPVLHYPGIGHGVDNHPLPLGTTTTIQICFRKLV